MGCLQELQIQRGLRTRAWYIEEGSVTIPVNPNRTNLYIATGNDFVAQLTAIVPLENSPDYATVIIGMIGAIASKFYPQHSWSLSDLGDILKGQFILTLIEGTAVTCIEVYSSLDTNMGDSITQLGQPINQNL